MSNRFILPVLLLATISLGLGVFLPVVEVRNLAIFANRFSIMEASWELLVDEQYLLGTVIIVFSVIFPFGKIITAGMLWQRFKNTGETPLKWIGRLEFLARWSCADVLIVAMAIVVAKASGIAGASMDIGLWFFAASIPLTATAVHLIKKTGES